MRNSDCAAVPSGVGGFVVVVVIVVTASTRRSKEGGVHVLEALAVANLIVEHKVSRLVMDLRCSDVSMDLFKLLQRNGCLDYEWIRIKCKNRMDIVSQSLGTPTIEVERKPRTLADHQGWLNASRHLRSLSALV